MFRKEPIQPGEIRFWKKLILFVVLLIVADRIVAGCMKVLYNNQKSGRYYRITQTNFHEKSDLLIFGSSIGVSGYIPDVFKELTGLETYNLSSWGNKTLYATIKQDLIFHHGYKPKVILFNVDQLLFYDNRLEGEYDKISIYLPYFDQLSPWAKELILSRSPWERLKMMVKTYPYNSKLFYIILCNVLKKDEGGRGFKALTDVVPDDAKDLWKQNMSNDPIEHRKIDFKKVEVYKHFIEQCRANNIKLIMVIAPPFEPFVPGNKSMPIVRQVIAEYKLPLWDYSEDNRFVGKNKLFADVMHLNNDGAKMFSRLVAERLRDELNSGTN